MPTLEVDAVGTAAMRRRPVRNLMTWSHAHVPGRIHDVRYDALVDDPEGTVARMLDHLDLPFHDDCLRFFDNDAPVATPSASQERRPLYRSSIGGWRRVAPHLSAARAELLRHGIAIGEPILDEGHAP